MKLMLPVFAALALGLAVPASAQEESAPPPPPAEPAAAVEESTPPPESEAEPGAPRRERPRRPGFGPRRDGPEGAAGPRRDGPGGPGRFGPGGRGGFGMNEGGSLGFLVPLLQKPETAAKIGLSEEKAQALAAAFADLDAQLKAVNGKLPAAFKRQAETLEATPVDEAAVLAAVNEVWDLRREVALLQTRKVLAIRSTLTAEQIEKARALLKEEWRAFGERRRDGEGRGPGGPGGEMRRGPGGRGPGHGGPGGRRGPKEGAPEASAEAAE